MRVALFGLVLAGCGLGGQNDGALETIVSQDTDDLARSVAEATTGLPGGDLSVTGTTEGVGDCMWSWSVEGPRTGAALTASIDTLPCGGDGSTPRLDWTYQVQSGDLGGTLAEAEEGKWSYDLTGTRTAELTATGPRETRTYDASLDLTKLVGTTDGENPAFDAEAAYIGWFGGAWDLVWSVAEDQSVTGTVEGPRGKSCVLGGVRGAVEVDCEE